MRRRLLGTALVLAGALVAGVTAYRVLRATAGRAPVAAHPIARAPHSLLIVTMDTTRADHLQPYGATDVATPALQHLADSGVLFTHAYSAAPITLVAHTTIHTGLLPPRHGVRNNGLHYVAPETTTLAERLRAAGYRTGAFVSAAVLEKRYGLDQGFEVYDDDLSGGRERHPRVVPDRPAEVTVAAARAWLATLKSGERFFLWVHFYDPHAVYSPPPPWRDRYREHLYDGEIAYMDSEIGKLLAEPRLAPGETVVVALADHGESLGEHGEQTHALLAYDATLHVPFLMRVPGGPAGLRVEAGVGQVDVVPTVLDLLGLAPVAGLEGKSLVPLLEGGRERDGPGARNLYAETYLPYYTYGWAKLRTLRRGRYKYVDAPRPELYDLVRDPRELANLVEREGNLAHDLKRDLRAVLGAEGDPERESALALDSESAEKLRSLGYLAVGSGAGADAAEERPDPKDVIGLHVGLETAHDLMRDRLWDQAIRKFREVLAKDPKNLSGLIDLASALEKSGDFEEALHSAERALARDPKYPRVHVVLAEIEIRRGRPAQALVFADRALELDPHFLDATILRAQLLARLERRKEAAAAIDAALAANPGHARLGAVHAQLVELPGGDLAGAETRLRAALQRDPFLVLGWRLLGETLESEGRVDEAVAACRSGLERAPDDADLHARLGILLARTGHDPTAEMHLREAIRLAEEFRSELHVALGAHLAEKGKLEEALHEYETVLAVDPKDAGARNNRAIAHYRLGRVAEAAAEWEKLVAEHPRLADAWSNLAALELDRKQWAKAAADARRALDLKPRIVEAWSNLGIAEDELGHTAQAEAHFRKALELDATYWQARNNLATTLRKEGRYDESAETFLATLQQVPSEPDVHRELGELYAGPLHDPERARTHWNAFLRALPGDPRAGEVRRKLAALPPPPAAARN